jgi:hypothetical protein
VDLVADPGVDDVQVRHALVEAVQVPLAGALVELPVGGLLAGEAEVLGALGGRLVGPHVEVTVRGVAVGPGRLEPRVVHRGVVDDQVGDHPDAALAGGAQELDQVTQAAQPRVDAVEVGDVVAAVPVGEG